MSTPVTINNLTFNYPDAGDPPGWGADATDAFLELAGVVGDLQSPNDILLSQFNIPDNVSSPTTLNGLFFSSSVRAAQVNYSIYRTSTDHPSGNAETGIVQLIYDTSAASTTKWKLTQNSNGNAGVVLSINDSGQVSFMSTQLDNGGGGYSGVMKFSAKTIGV
jgi:hypothetical protein